MKEKMDRYLIYFIYVFEFVYTISSMYFNNYTSTYTISINTISIFKIAYCMIFIVGILYVLFLVYKLGHHEIVDLKKIQGYCLALFLWIWHYIDVLLFLC